MSTARLRRKVLNAIRAEGCFPRESLRHRVVHIRRFKNCRTIVSFLGPRRYGRAIRWTRSEILWGQAHAYGIMLPYCTVSLDVCNEIDCTGRL